MLLSFKNNFANSKSTGGVDLTGNESAAANPGAINPPERSGGTIPGLLLKLAFLAAIIATVGMNF